MSTIFSEKNLVKILFILVLVVFSFAQEDSRKMNTVYSEAPEIQNRSGLLGDLSARQAAGFGTSHFKD